MTLTTVDTLYAEALGGAPCEVVGDGISLPLPVADWDREPDLSDLEFLDRCRGPILDVGCGPGRLAAALQAGGEHVLGIDTEPAAVEATRQRGAAALTRDVFATLPGEGTWGTALLADGNIGIGGDPQALLLRMRALLRPGGIVVADVYPPGTPSTTLQLALARGEDRGPEFPWAIVGLDSVRTLARSSGFTVADTVQRGGRWWVVLEHAPSRDS